jgi:hypothetical protein
LKTFKLFTVYKYKKGIFENFLSNSFPTNNLFFLKINKRTNIRWISN